jgi:hypothetical protein
VTYLYGGTSRYTSHKTWREAVYAAHSVAPEVLAIMKAQTPNPEIRTEHLN